MFSARKIGDPIFDFSKVKINWQSDFKYLGYVISSKLGWGKLIKQTKEKVRKRISLIKSFKLFGCSSASLRKTLFHSYILPIFTWIYPVFPLLTRIQQNDLSHFYYSSLRRCLYCLEWNDNFFSFVLDELSLEDRCASYWNRYLIFLADSLDGSLLFEHANLSVFRQCWLNKEFPIACLRRSKRFVPHQSLLEKIVRWISSVPLNSSVTHFDLEDLVVLQHFPESF